MKIIEELTAKVGEARVDRDRVEMAKEVEREIQRMKGVLGEEEERRKKLGEVLR
jgi:hypothetical protein